MPSDHALTEPRILVVDDEAANLQLVERILASGGYEDVHATTDPREGLEDARRTAPDLVLLDLLMPGMDGLEVLGRLEESLDGFAYLPVVVLTSDTSREARRTALEAGADDFLTKPLSPQELRLRVDNLLETRGLHLALQDYSERLEERVRERTSELERAQIEILERLALAAEHRHRETGRHTRRVGELARELAEQLGLSDRMLERLRWAAPLHDVGKIGIDDAILRKPGELSDEELAAMRDHAAIGGEILSGSSFEILQLAEEIARHHHENWDGSGYPQGLSGEEIPVSARIVAVADVFDSLTHDRVYQEAIEPAEARSFIREHSGTKFDPDVVEALEAVLDGGRER